MYLINKEIQDLMGDVAVLDKYAVGISEDNSGDVDEVNKKPESGEYFACIDRVLKGSAANMCIGTVDRPLARKNEDGDIVSWAAEIRFLGQQSHSKVVEGDRLLKIPEKLFFKMMHLFETNSQGVVKMLASLIPSESGFTKEEKEQLKKATFDLDAAMAAPTIVNINLDSDYHELELKVTDHNVHVWDGPKDRPWELKRFFMLTHGGQRVKGILKKARGKYSVELHAGVLSPEQYAWVKAAIWNKFAGDVDI